MTRRTVAVGAPDEDREREREGGGRASSLVLSRMLLYCFGPTRSPPPSENITYRYRADSNINNTMFCTYVPCVGYLSSELNVNR